MKLLTYLLYTLLIATFFSCGHPQKKKNMEWKKHKIEQNDSIKRHHPDSIVKHRDKRYAKRKKRSEYKNDSII